MVTWANPSGNKVCINWLKSNEKCVKYFKKFGKKKLSFIGEQDTKKEALKVKKFRESRYDKKTEIVKLGKTYLLYSH